MSDDELFGLIDMMHERDESDDNLLEWCNASHIILIRLYTISSTNYFRN
jgi:hypothetical protein